MKCDHVPNIIIYHEMSPNIIICHMKCPLRVLPSRCHQMSWNVFQFNMVTFDYKSWHVLMWSIWFREVSLIVKFTYILRIRWPNSLLPKSWLKYPFCQLIVLFSFASTEDTTTNGKIWQEVHFLSVFRIITHEYSLHLQYKGSTINHLGGGVVRIEKKHMLGGSAKKKFVQGASEKKITFGQFDPKKIFFYVFSVKKFLWSILPPKKISFEGSPKKKFRSRKSGPNPPPTGFMVAPAGLQNCGSLPIAEFWLSNRWTEYVIGK